MVAALTGTNLPTPSGGKTGLDQMLLWPPNALASGLYGRFPGRYRSGREFFQIGEWLGNWFLGIEQVVAASDRPGARVQDASLGSGCPGQVGPERGDRHGVVGGLQKGEFFLRCPQPSRRPSPRPSADFSF